MSPTEFKSSSELVFSEIHSCSDIEVVNVTDEEGIANGYMELEVRGDCNFRRSLFLWTLYCALNEARN